jgi:hypothetical protein
MATRAITPANFPKSYAELRAAVKVTLFQGQRAADHAKVRRYHETDRLIRHHVLANQDRADYGAKTILSLAPICSSTAAFCSAATHSTAYSQFGPRGPN